MGERSDFFVRIRAKEKTSDKFYKHQAFFGLYYQWCYGERMISRLRSALDFVESDISGRHGSYAITKEQMDRFKRYLAINFDMHDILEPVDLIPETVDDIINGFDTAKSDIFDKAENHGFIYLDITLDDPEEKFGENKANIKYAFVDNEYHSKKYPLPPIRSVENFADHDIGDDERKWYEPDPYWEEEKNSGWGPAHKENFLKNIVPTTKKNIAEIEQSATLMTEDDRKDFVKFGRAFTRKILKKAEKEKAEIKAKRESLITEIQSSPLPRFNSKLYTQLLELVDKAYPKPQRE